MRGSPTHQAVLESEDIPSISWLQEVFGDKTSHAPSYQTDTDNWMRKLPLLVFPLRFDRYFSETDCDPEKG